MSNDSANTFQRDFIKGESSQQTQAKEQWLHELKELIKPEEVGEKHFVYDSEEARNFDQTNVKRAREGVKEILSDAIDKAKSKTTKITTTAICQIPILI